MVVCGSMKHDKFLLQRRGLRGTRRGPESRSVHARACGVEGIVDLFDEV